MTVTPFDSVTVNVSVAFTTAPFAAPSWTDISAYVMSADIKPGGRQSSLDQFSAGTLAVQLDGSDRRFDPVYASGAYNPNVKPRKKIKVEVTYSAVTYPMFVGFVDGWPNIGEPSNHLGIVKVTATDGFKMLARNRLPNTGVAVGAGETVTARIGRLLDYAGWPAADRDIDTDSPTVIALVPAGQPIMDELYMAANADLGQIFIANDGKFTYRGHRWQLGNNLTSTATLGENAGEIGYNQLPSYSYDDTQIFNRAQAQGTFGPLLLAASLDVSDATSITAYGESSRNIGTVTAVNQNVVQNTLEWTVFNYKDPKFYAESVGICRPTSSAAAATVYPVIFAAENGTRWTLNRRPQNVGSAISQDVIIESVSHSLTPDFWQSTFTLSQAPAAPDGGTYWRMGFGKWTTGTPSATWA